MGGSAETAAVGNCSGNKIVIAPAMVRTEPRRKTWASIEDTLSQGRNTAQCRPGSTQPNGCASVGTKRAVCASIRTK